MSRSKIVTAAALVQTAYAVMVAILAWFSIAMAIGAQNSSGRVPRSGLVNGAILLGVIALVYGVGAFGLWRARLWAWWWSLLAFVLTLAALLWDIFIDKDRDPDNWVAVAIIAGPILLLCVAGRFFPRAPRAKITTA